MGCGGSKSEAKDGSPADDPKKLKLDKGNAKPGTPPAPVEQAPAPAEAPPDPNAQRDRIKGMFAASDYPSVVALHAAGGMKALTPAQSKDILKSLELELAGKKDELVVRIVEHAKKRQEEHEAAVALAALEAACRAEGEAMAARAVAAGIEAHRAAVLAEIAERKRLEEEARAAAAAAAAAAKAEAEAAAGYIVELALSLAVKEAKANLYTVKRPADKPTNPRAERLSFRGFLEGMLPDMLRSHTAGAPNGGAPDDEARASPSKHWATAAKAVRNASHAARALNTMATAAATRSPAHGRGSVSTARPHAEGPPVSPEAKAAWKDDVKAASRVMAQREFREWQSSHKEEPAVAAPPPAEAGTLPPTPEAGEPAPAEPEQDPADPAQVEPEVGAPTEEPPATESNVEA